VDFWCPELQDMQIVIVAACSPYRETFVFGKIKKMMAQRQAGQHQKPDVLGCIVLPRPVKGQQPEQRVS
jgi:hypothetical protein